MQIKSKCIPVCTAPCLNGICTAPEVCNCLPGYHNNSFSICIKNECDPAIVVSDECSNGTCTPYGTCLCNQGFVKKYSNLESSVDSKCVPVCSIGCMNGYCASPEMCACNFGYEALNSSVCDPICTNDCLFGNCTEPDKCTCFVGYELQKDSDHICKPVCSSECLNGKCVETNLCLCNKGFEFNEESKECEPFCDEECVNSNCTSPNVCTCEMGFTPVNSTHCDVLCENCIHGYCEEPNVCQCDIDYHMNIEGDTCVENECASDLLKESCENGFCSDGICECESGYNKSAVRVCSPICSLKCINGYCAEPEYCQCNIGYELSAFNGTDDGNCTNCTTLTEWNVCYATCEDCQNGTCNDGTCNCVDGYIHHPENRGKCVGAAELYDLKTLEALENRVSLEKPEK